VLCTYHYNGVILPYHSLMLKVSLVLVRAGGSFEEAFPEHGAVEAVVMGPVATPAGRRHGTLELSARPSAVAAANAAGALIPPAADLASLRAGQAVQG
jgi:hypothetical protein